MNKSLKYVVVPILLVLAFAVPSFSQGFSADNKPTPIFCDSGDADTYYSVYAASAIGTACPENPARLDGEIINISTYTLKMSLGNSTTTTIDAAPFLLYPRGDSYARDRYQLKRNDNVYRGAIYFYGYDATLGTGVDAKRDGRITYWEWK